MSKKLALAVTVALVLPAAGAAGAAEAAPAQVRTFTNCTAMNKTYRHGVGRKGAKDVTKGKRVTTFLVDDRIYAANKKLDRDKDGIACEKL